MVAALGDEAHVDEQRARYARPAGRAARRADRGRLHRSSTPRPGSTCGRPAARTAGPPSTGWPSAASWSRRAPSTARAAAARPGRADRDRRARGGGRRPAARLSAMTTGRVGAGPGRALGRVRAAVVGTGLIGGSVLLRLREAGLDVAGWDPDPATRRQARRRASRPPRRSTRRWPAGTWSSSAARCPPCRRPCCRVAGVTGDRCVLTDVGSTKAELAAFAARARPRRPVRARPPDGRRRPGRARPPPRPACSTAPPGCSARADGPATGRVPVAGRAGRRRLPRPGGADVRRRSTTRPRRSPPTCRTCSPGRWPGRCSAPRCATRCSRSPPAASATAPGSPATPAERTANMLLGNRDRVLRQLAEVTALPRRAGRRAARRRRRRARRPVRRGAGGPARAARPARSTPSDGGSRPVGDHAAEELACAAASWARPVGT